MNRKHVAHAAMLACSVVAVGFAGCGEGADTATSAAAPQQPADPGLGSDGHVFEDAAAPRSSCMTPDDVWTASSIPAVSPTQFGAVANDNADDSDALLAAVDALPATGGVVTFPAGTLDKHNRLWLITKNHVHLWSPNGRGTLHTTARARTVDELARNLCGVRQHATLFRNTSGGGVFGLRITGNATERTTCAEDSQIVLQSVNGMDIVGNDITGSTGAGVFVARASNATVSSQNTFLEGNFVHHTWADSIHHTAAARRSFAWRNIFFNEAPSLGDDGIACVTYSPADPRCGEMEWFNNFYLGGAHGRGFAVIGGEDINIHHNWVIGSAAAGLIVASEAFYGSGSPERVQMTSNWLVNSPNGSVNNGHPAILIDGGNTAAAPVRDVQSVDNVIVDPARGHAAERVSGLIDSASVVTRDSTDRTLLPAPQPTLATVKVQDTSVLRTHDVSFVDAAARKGLYRIHLREAAAGRLQNRFEYLVSGLPADVTAWLRTASTAGAYQVETRTVGSRAVALVLAPAPMQVPATLDAVTFDQLRAGDRDTTLAWLWGRVDGGQYTAPVCRRRLRGT